MYIKFLKSLLAHKWYVFLAGLKTGVPIWRLIVHDWQKFTHWEFGAYAQNFFPPDGLNNSETLDALARYKVAELAPFGHFAKERFAYAWLHHENTAPHHWGYWIARSGKYTGPLPMPETYVREMVADWMGASKAYTGSWNMDEWLSKNWPQFQDKLHRETAELLHGILVELGYAFTGNPPLIWVFKGGANEQPT
jgi:hypothetical protein